jgi:hypothetical protein
MRTGEEAPPMKERESEPKQSLKLGLYRVDICTLFILYCRNESQRVDDKIKNLKAHHTHIAHRPIKPEGQNC